MCVLFSACHANPSDAMQTVEELAWGGWQTSREWAEGDGQDGGGSVQAGREE